LSAVFLIIAAATACATSNPRVGGDCHSKTFEGRCEFMAVVRHDTSTPGYVVLESTWKMTAASPTPGVRSELPYQQVVPVGDADRLEAHLRALPGVACRYFTFDPCNAPDPVVDVPPLPPATTP
jgi:hypothetical protein